MRIHSRAKGSTPYQVGHDEALYPINRIMATADLASSLTKNATAELERRLRDSDSAVRYWAALGLLMRGLKQPLEGLLTDSSPYVRIVAAEALGRYGTETNLREALPSLLNLASPAKTNVFVALAALGALDDLGGKVEAVRERIRGLESKDPNAYERFGGYVRCLLRHIEASGSRPKAGRADTSPGARFPIGKEQP